jgi:LPXTG-motif cell wall-anchored protein
VNSLPDLSITLPSGTLANSQVRSKTNVPVIVGATFGAIGGLVLLGVVVFILYRRRKSKLDPIEDPIEEINPGSLSITPVQPPLPSKSLQAGNLAGARSAVSGSSSDGDWRGEMEQLRRVVETLSVQAQQPQAYHGVPDEPPPMYNNPTI